MKIYLVFYILLFKLVDPSISIQNAFYFKIEKETKYKVKKILD